MGDVFESVTVVANAAWIVVRPAVKCAVFVGVVVDPGGHLPVFSGLIHFNVIFVIVGRVQGIAAFLVSVVVKAHAHQRVKVRWWVVGHTRSSLPVGLQPASTNVLTIALRALERSLVCMESSVKFQVDKLREFSVAALAVKGLLSRVEPHVSL